MGLWVSPQKLMYRRAKPWGAIQLRDGFWGETHNPTSPNTAAYY